LLLLQHGTTEWATNQEGSPVNDEVHVAVIDEDGKFSGTKGAVLETWPFLSIAKGAKTNAGGTNYMPDVINRASNYIWFGGFDDSDVVNGTLWGQVPTGGADDFATGVSWTNNDATTSLANGRDSQALTENEYALAFDLIEDVESVDVQILVAPGLSSEDAQVTVVNDLAAIATGIRKDCVVVASPPRSAVVNNATPVNSTVTFANRLTASNYLIVDNNYLRVYDKYNDQYLYIPAASSTAGLIAATDANYAPWYSPAGLKRGQYTGIVGLAYSANKADRDTLYKASINPIVTFPGEGTVLWGDKTKQGRPSAFDRINVRRLFLAVEKAISIAARSVLFEFNDEFTRSEFVGIIEPVLREVQARRGIQEFYVQCDETNNTPAVIDRNELIASIFIKPARSINFITLNFVAVRTGVSFEEVVGTV
jgi:phage tail sheath protein FI